MTNEGNYVKLEIRVVRGPNKGLRRYFDKNIITVGRGAINDISLAADPQVAAAHAEVHRTGNAFVIYDKSGSGIECDRRRVDRAILVDRTQIALGKDTVLEFRLSGYDKKAETGRKDRSLLRRPVILIVGGVYLAGLFALVLYLSGDSSLSRKQYGSEEALRMLSQYAEQLERQADPQKGQKLQVIQDYLKSGHLAEKEGRLNDARRIYSELLIKHSSDKDVVYEFALNKLQELLQ